MKPTKPSADMRWFRLYHDVLDDDKVQELPSDLFKFWVNLLCLASKGEPRGRVPMKDSTIAFRLRVSPAKVTAMMKRLEEAGLIDTESETLRVMHNWDRRQPLSDNGAARQKGWRDRQRDAERNVTDNVTSDVTDNGTHNNTVTPRAREDLESATQTDNNNENKTAVVVSSSGGPPAEETIPVPTERDMIPIDAGPHSHPPADFEAVYQKVWRCWGSQKLCHQFYRRQRRFSLARWTEAFGTAKSQEWKPGAIGYVETIAANPKKNGRTTSGGAGEFEKPAPPITYHVAPADSPYRKRPTE